MQGTVSRSGSTGSRDSGQLGSALGSKKGTESVRTSPSHPPRAMGPLTEVKSAVKQAVPERGTEHLRGPQNICEVPERFPKLLPDSRARAGGGSGLGPGPGHRQPQAEDGDRDGGGVGGTGDAWGQSCPAAAPWTAGFVFSGSVLPVPAQHAGTPGVGEDGEPTEPGSPPRPKPTVQARSRRFPVALSTSRPGASQGSALRLVPKVGPSPQHSAHPEASHAGARSGDGACWLCRAATSQDETPAISWGPE